MSTTWTIAVDWDRTGSYTGTYDDLSDYVIEATWYLGMKKPYQTIADNSVLALTLNNSDRRFSPEYADSPLYGDFLPMRPIQVKAGDTVMWEGWLESLKPVPGRYGQRITHMMAHGPMPIYMDAEAKIDLQENKRTDEIILRLIREVVVPPAGSNAWLLGGAKLGVGTYLLPASAYSDLETGQVMLDMAADNWVKNGGRRDEDQDVFDVYRAISDIANVEDGKFFFDRDGTAVFWNRHHVMDYDPGSMSPACTLDDQMTGMEYTYMSLDAVKNDIIVTCHPRTVSTETDVTLWDLTDGQKIQVDAHDEYALEIRYTDDSDNRIGGRSVTYSNLEFAGYGAHATLTVEAKANGAKLRFKNTSSKPAVVTGLKIVGQKITDEGPMDATATDGAYKAQHGRRTLRRNIPSCPTLEQAQYIADHELIRRKEPRGDVASVTLISHATEGGGQHTHQIARTIGDLIRLQETQTDHDQTYYLIGEKHKVNFPMGTFETTWFFEPVPSYTPWKLGVSGRSTLGISTRLTY